MGERLFVAVMGNRNSGKSTTWNTLFSKVVRTGKNERRLELYPGVCVDVFLVSGSFEERKEYAEEKLADNDASIVLCSIQYISQVRTTLDYAFEAGFSVHIQWLNPGYGDGGVYYDNLGLEPQILARGGTVSIRSGAVPAKQRVQELREVVHGWAYSRGLLIDCE